MPEPEKKKRGRGKAKLTKDMKEILHLAFERAGGVDYLVKQSKAEPKAFMALLGRMVPAQVSVDVAHHINLGAEILKARENLDKLRVDNPTMIDITPETPTTPSPKLLKVKDNSK